MDRFLYAAYRQNLRRNQLRPNQKPARIERPYLWMRWTAHGIAWALGRAQQRRLYKTKTSTSIVDR